MTDPELIASLERAVAANPSDHALRLHLAEQLVAADRVDDAIVHCRRVLVDDPLHDDALSLFRRLTVASQDLPYDEGVEDQAELVEVPVFPEGLLEADDVSQPTITLADVGGMEDVKTRLEQAFLGPARNPSLRAYFGKSLRGGLLLYGPPGCGKTFIARALAGELGAGFIAVGLSDVLDMWLGESERKLHDIFALARRQAPAVIFLDELDALGQKRTHLRGSAGRNVVNQLLTELDGAKDDNEGVFVLGATNHPWDVDTALRRPGRFDRLQLVLPPDADARRAILGYHMRERPLEERIDLGKLAVSLKNYSGADIAHLTEVAAGYALADSIERGEPRPISKKDVELAAREVQPSTGAWFQTAYNFALFANEGGLYDDLLRYIREHNLA